MCCLFEPERNTLSMPGHLGRRSTDQLGYCRTKIAARKWVICHRENVDCPRHPLRSGRCLQDGAFLVNWYLSHNGPEFAGKVLDAWAYEAGVTLSFIRPGKPVENAYIESFNGRFRDECLNEHWFVSMRHARQLIEEWRIEYNTERPHSSLGYLTPARFAQGHEQNEFLTPDSTCDSY